MPRVQKTKPSPTTTEPEELERAALGARGVVSVWDVRSHKAGVIAHHFRGHSPVVPGAGPIVGLARGSARARPADVGQRFAHDAQLAFVGHGAGFAPEQANVGDQRARYFTGQV